MTPNAHKQHTHKQHHEPRNQPPSRWQATWRGAGSGALIGCAVAALAAFLGDIRATSPLLLGLIVFCALLGTFGPTRRLLNSAGGVLALAVALCLLTPVLRGPLNALTLEQAPVKADAIVVLGGGVQCGARTLESSSLLRLVKGLELWQAGYAPLITVSEQSGIFGPHSCVKMSELERQHITALYPQGGPEVLTLHNVTTTRDEAARLRDYAHKRGWQRILLVTSPSHSRRAQALFQRYGVNAVSVPGAETRFDTELLLPSDRLYAFKILTYEWLSRLKLGLGGTPER